MEDGSEKGHNEEDAGGKIRRREVKLMLHLKG